MFLPKTGSINIWKLCWDATLVIEPILAKLPIFYLYKSLSFFDLPIVNGNGLFGCWIGVFMIRLLIGLLIGNGLLPGYITLSYFSDLALSESKLSWAVIPIVPILGIFSYPPIFPSIPPKLYLFWKMAKLFSNFLFSSFFYSSALLDAKRVGILKCKEVPLSIFLFFISKLSSNSFRYLFSVE